MSSAHARSDGGRGKLQRRVTWASVPALGHIALLQDELGDLAEVSGLSL